LLQASPLHTPWARALTSLIRYDNLSSI
jgi:hypothetical protein